MSARLALIQAVLILGIPLGLWLLPVVRKVAPLVVLQIGVGFLLGPSLFGRADPNRFASLFPPGGTLPLEGLAFYGVLLFVFLTGTHLDASQLVRERDSRSDDGAARPLLHEFWATAILSLLVPMLLGFLAAALLWSQLPILHGPTSTRLPFLFALGIATGVTALPVLSAILIESNHIDTPVGQLVIANATFHDGILWILLAILLTYADAGSGQIQQPLVVLLQLALYLSFMLFVMRPALVRLARTAWWTTLPEVARLALEMVGLLLSAWITESIGVHYLIGAVLYGAILPGSIKRVLISQVEPVVVALLLPFFFVSAGLQTRFDLAEPAVWIVFVTMTVMKLGGQFVGTTLPLRLLFGRPWPFALQSGAYMACSGIVEIVVLGLAYEQGILSGTAYAGTILSALAATAATKPLVAAFGRLSAVHIHNPIIRP